MRLRELCSLLVGGALMAGAGSAWAWRDGAEVYAKVCRHCHEANVGPVLKGRNLPVEYVRQVVRQGNRAMPAFRASEIDDGALNDVARLVSTSAPLAKE